MRIQVSSRSAVKRLTDKLAGGKNIHRKQNQLRAAKHELQCASETLTPKKISQTIRSRAFAARLAHSRLEQLRSMRKVLAENPRIALALIEIATNTSNPREAPIMWWAAELLLDRAPGIRSTEWVKQLIRDMKDPQQRKKRIAELEKPFIPEGTRIKTLLDAQSKKKKS